MLDKKAELTTQELLEIILAGAASLVLVVFLVGLFYSEYNKEEKTAEAYFDSFLSAVSSADSGDGGSFLMWQPEEDVKYYLVGFGGLRRVDKEGVEFVSFGKNENHVCLCYSEDGDVKCDYCDDLDRPIFVGEDENWVVGVGEEIRVSVAGGRYAVSKV